MWDLEIKLYGNSTFAPRGVLVKENSRGVSFFYQRMAAPKKNAHYQKTDDGRMVFLDKDRHVVGTQKMNKRNALRLAQGKKPIDFSGITKYLWRNNKNGVPLFVQADVYPDDYPDDYELFPQTEEMMMAVIQLVADGKTLRTIGQIPGMPPVSMVMRWCGRNEDFKDALAEARKSRAEVYHDAIENVAFNTKETNAKSSKVKIDALKFLAGVNDRDRFGQAKAVEGGGMSVSFIVNTGIADQPIAVEGKVVDAASSQGEAPASGGDGLPAEASPAGDPQQAEEVQSSGLPPPIR